VTEVLGRRKLEERDPASRLMEGIKMFVDRREAGERLAEALLGFASEDPVVLGLPRGGVPVAAEVASALHAPLDVLVVRKLGCPWQPELGVGAIGEGGVRVVNASLIEMLNISQEQLDQIVAREESEVARRVHRYRGDRLPVGVEGRTVIIVDDGLATGFTAQAGIEVVRHLGARRVVLAVPVAPREGLEQLRAVADEAVALETPDPFFGIGQFYLDFAQTSDEEVTDLLGQSRVRSRHEGPGGSFDRRRRGRRPGSPSGHPGRSGASGGRGGVRAW
jgi:putative phosphoribosyl transferase